MEAHGNLKSVYLGFEWLLDLSCVVKLENDKQVRSPVYTRTDESGNVTKWQMSVHHSEGPSNRYLSLELLEGEILDPWGDAKTLVVFYFKNKDEDLKKFKILDHSFRKQRELKYYIPGDIDLKNTESEIWVNNKLTILCHIQDIEDHDDTTQEEKCGLC